MARVTVEDCIQKVDNRFDLVLISSSRARVLHNGEKPTVDPDNDKTAVIALREIAEGTVEVEDIKADVIKSFQLYSQEENIEDDNNSEESEEAIDIEEKNKEGMLLNESIEKNDNINSKDKKIDETTDSPVTENVNNDTTIVEKNNPLE